MKAQKKISRLSRATIECTRHTRHIGFAMDKMLAFMPLGGTSYEGLSTDEIAAIDQFVFRFSKLQDALGLRLIPSLLRSIGEEVKSMTFIDRLARLEQLDLVTEVEWMELRRYRNNIAHEYSIDPDEAAASINVVYDNAHRLISISECMLAFCFEKKLNELEEE